MTDSEIRTIKESLTVARRHAKIWERAIREAAEATRNQVPPRSVPYAIIVAQITKAEYEIANGIDPDEGEE